MTGHATVRYGDDVRFPGTDPPDPEVVRVRAPRRRGLCRQDDRARVAGMATWADVERVATALPEVTESTSWGNRAWKVAGKTFVWARPLGRRDRADLADAVPAGEVLGVRVTDEGQKSELLAAEPDVCFTIPHFEGFAAVLVRLDDVHTDLLAELVTDAWRCRAPSKLLRTTGD